MAIEKKEQEEVRQTVQNSNDHKRIEQWMKETIDSTCAVTHCKYIEIYKINRSFSYNLLIIYRSIKNDVVLSVLP